ncbi:MAG TPA: segregation/condensation protein A [Methanospirillum sp.]|uniref:segregation/condensation protein A n=1 Tax=Methanospirillum sp. TaxID=45200 RepID=UPI002BE352C4|nr:segregation/condensation protein A [Methanospirillum sp.]HOJ96011.1 segregation/condensation protein A [Methanospirillum sp.]HOL40825.1 segregation/condensation protein A [Methanospirillum sp.]HPP78893.1 segregation/condensation protein A [Methanospirillum sp.]
MTHDPVEILVKMAERGEIDPWNIDITEVTDRFFAEMEKQEVLDLRLSARTLLYAAILLRIKSDYLKDPFFDEDDGDTGEDPDFTDDNESAPRVHNPVQLLEYEIARRLERKSMRKQPITLYDLINLLRNAEKEERRRQREVWSHEGPVYTEDVVSIAHEEAYQENAMEVLNCCVDCLSSGRSVTLSEVANRLSWPVAHVFIPLLFLMYEGYLELHQDTFFGEVYIEPNAASFAAMQNGAGLSTT